MVPKNKEKEEKMDKDLKPKDEARTVGSEQELSIDVDLPTLAKLVANLRFDVMALFLRKLPNLRLKFRLPRIPSGMRVIGPR